MPGLPPSAPVTHFASVAEIIQDPDAAKAGQIGTGVTAKDVLLDTLRLDIQNH